MANWFDRLIGRASLPAEQKSAQSLMAVTALGDATWSKRNFPQLAHEGFVKNPIVHACIRMIAEAATRVPFAVD